MATNKRKDAAALFELIGKSSLKVPKNAGSLKIPNWWSSKSAAPAATTTPAKPDPAPAEPPRTPVPTPIAHAPAPAIEDAPPATQPAAPLAENTPAETPVQHRLFDPPPANFMPDTAPSIRPPAAGVPAISPAKPAAPDPPPLPAPHVPASEKPVPAEREVPATPPTPAAPPPPNFRDKPKSPPSTPRAFVPPTMARERVPWSPRPGVFARLPVWVMATGAVVLFALVVVIVYAARHAGKSRTADTRPSGGSPPATAISISRGGNTIPATRGVIYKPGQYPYVLGHYYIVICSTPSLEKAQEYATWLADHRISVSIELKQVRPTMMYTLIEAFDFPNATATAEAIAEIRRVGSLRKENPNPFKDAQPDHTLRSPDSTPAPEASTPARRGLP